jgi:hypothetical protein
MKNKGLIFIGVGALLYLYSKSGSTEKKENFYLVDGKKVAEKDLSTLGYYYYFTDDGTVPSGYYNYTYFPSGFGSGLDIPAFYNAIEHINNKVDQNLILTSHQNLKNYYNGELPLQKV